MYFKHDDKTWLKSIIDNKHMNSPVDNDSPLAESNTNTAY